ncbi:MAG: Glu/Leu/Phe/Val dehydrogenase dimerization domain-containing protein, partial [Planctomycetota bacterium]
MSVDHVGPYGRSSGGGTRSGDLTELNNMELIEIPVDGYERVVKCHDPESGLRAIIGVHDTTLGPALGGLRMWPYETEDEALTDVLRLSRGMTYKSAVANTGLGGGKSVIIGNAKTDKSEALFRAMGRFVDSFDGMYTTAEDVGIGIRELEWIREETNHVTGLSRASGSSGNPSPFTARGVTRGLRAVTEEAFGTSRLDGFHYAIQGLGHVGMEIARGLSIMGSFVTVADIDEEKIAEFTSLPGVEAVDPDKIYDVECDVFVPCALGGILDDNTIPRLRCKAVAGAANNQLLVEDTHAKMLKDRGILYAPDYVINAGGIVNVSVEVGEGGYDERAAVQKIENIYTALQEVFATARQEDITTAEAADRVAEQRLEEARARRG